MAVRSTPLWGPTALTTSSGVVLPGTSGRTAIVKSLFVHNTAGSTRRAFFYWNGDTDPDIIFTVPAPAGETVMVNGLFLVVDLNYDLWADASGAGLVCSAFGAYLAGDPS